MDKKFSAKIFIDGGEPEETKEAKKLLGFLDGQTTNPTLIAKNLAASVSSAKLTQDEALGEYKRIAGEISKIIPHGSVSIQVFANGKTESEEMLSQARERTKWIPNASIKFPCNAEGLKAASVACKEMPINITLVFTQSQAAAVYEATLGAKHPVFISPFVGRLDDRGENGMDVVSNMIKMYQSGDKHVEVLTASVRNIAHILYALYLKSNIVTVPFKVFRQWADKNFMLPAENFVYNPGNLKAVPFRKDIMLGKPWQEYDLFHDLTDIGIEKFSADWNSLVQSS
ncbi:transaldolase [Candidatus Gottesmanbacteria bacterium]|nr:transaldolase [Candidatus Gottesmanbacteria bacterium]